MYSLNPWTCKKIREFQICDNTLREGEQAPGVAFAVNEKVAIASMLDEVGIEVIETGFPAVSEEERVAIKKITELGLDARTSGLCRASETDVDLAAECDLDWVSIFVATSDLHLKYKYGCSREEVVDKMVDALTRAKEYGLKVRVAAEDATRTNLEFLKDFYVSAEQNGADMVSIADTVGILNPSSTAYLVEEVKKEISLPVAVHFHNDLGMATANTLTALEHGAYQIQTTVNGIGERAGNASLEEVVVSLRVLYGVEKYRAEWLKEISRMVEEFSGVSTAPTKPVVGDHVFTHESGIHVAAVVENPNTYEPFSPEMVGMERRFIIGKHTGKKALRALLAKEGIYIEENELNKLLKNIKVRSGRFKESFSVRELVSILKSEKLEKKA